MSLRIAFAVIFVAALLYAASSATGPIRFQDVSSGSRVEFFTENSPTPTKQQPEGLISGVAVFDYDGDGYLDIYCVNGANMPSLVKEGPQHSNRLYRNNGNLTFTDVTERAGVGGEGYGMGVSVGDYDNDGWPDLYISNVNANQLFRNNGDGTFTDVTAKAGVAGGMYAGKKMWSVAAAWVDYDNDGQLDLFVSNYCVWNAVGGPECKIKDDYVYCSPRHYLPLPHTLYRNNGDGTFTDVSDQTGISEHLGRGMGVVIADYDNDGFQDVFVSNDDAPFQLFRNLGGKRFEQIATEVGVAYPENGNVISGMGADFRDLFNKGLPSIWVTAIEKETFPLFVNIGKGQFAEKTAPSALGLDTYEMSGWSNVIADLDNDGWKDLMVVRSNVQENVTMYSPRQWEEPISVFRNLSTGRFQNLTSSSGLQATPAGHRGLAVGDLDNDGLLDAVSTVLRGKARVLRNTSPPDHHWLLLKLTGTTSNRMGIGAKIKVTGSDGAVQYNHVTTSTGYGCSSDSRVHFGLGKAASATEIEILWPSGKRQVLADVKANRQVTIEEP
jgi:enediyne biosynthesis protein E4